MNWRHASFADRATRARFKAECRKGGGCPRISWIGRFSRIQDPPGFDKRNPVPQSGTNQE